MPFKEVSINSEIERRCADSPEFKKSWEESRAEYRLIGEMISLRKQEGITQSQLAAMTGNRQQVISRIERREHVPSLKLFRKISRNPRQFNYRDESVNCAYLHTG